MAKLGIALGSGPRGRGFESPCSDQKHPSVYPVDVFLVRKFQQQVACIFFENIRRDKQRPAGCFLFRKVQVQVLQGGLRGLLGGDDTV